MYINVQTMVVVLVVVDEKEISRLCTKRGESAFSMYLIAEAHAYQLQFPAMYLHESLYTAHMCLCELHAR